MMPPRMVTSPIWPISPASIHAMTRSGNAGDDEGRGGMGSMSSFGFLPSAVSQTWPKIMYQAAPEPKAGECRDHDGDDS